MQNAVRFLYIVVGSINFAPIVGLGGAPQLEALYGPPIPDGDVLLLLRHRAVLLAIVGGLLLYAAVDQRARAIAAAAGFVSMLSFVALATLVEAPGAALVRVAWIDVGACLLLAVGLVLDRRRR